MRVLIFSHAHPLFSKGGGEFAAYYLYQGIKATDEHEAWFVARSEERFLNPNTVISAINEREFLLFGNAGIPELCTTLPLDNNSDFVSLLRSIQPDVVHFHHYVNLGLELIRVVSNICPQAQIIMTLHEYIAICHHNGQMIKTNHKLCYQYSPRECSQCYPDKTSEYFFLRERYIKSFFELVDVFISPSDFLRERYIAWGLVPDKIKVLENGLPVDKKLPPRALQADESRGRLAYFGQINPYKGVDIILDAFAMLSQRLKKQVSLDIFGSGLEHCSADFQNEFNNRLNADTQCVHFHGAYEAHELKRLMRDIDWVVMGSIWWENSPLVIQEAFKFGRPVICPDIGGMAEKVLDDVNGIHYRARDSVSLARVIERVVNNRDGYEALYQNLPEVFTVEACVLAHLELYMECK